jgi:hypothetical protein
VEGPVEAKLRNYFFGAVEGEAGEINYNLIVKGLVCHTLEQTRGKLLQYFR